MPPSNAFSRLATTRSLPYEVGDAMTLPNGYTLVFGGTDFLLDDFTQGGASLLDAGATIIRRGERSPHGEALEYSALEFSDIHDGTYPLDPMTEALDLLRKEWDEFSRLAAFPGISFRTLNIFGDAMSCTLALSAKDIADLHSLSMALSVCPYRLM